MTLKKEGYDTFYNIVIICWLFFSVSCIYLGFIGSYVSSNFNATLNELNFHSIFSNVIQVSSEAGKNSITFENLTVALTIIGSFLIYCYFFDLIQKKGFLIFKLEGQESKFSSALPYIFFSCLFVLYFVVMMIPNAYTYLKYEVQLILVFLAILFISLFFYSELIKTALTYEGLKRINKIKLYESKIPLKFELIDQISFCYTFVDLISIITFLFTLFTVLISFKLNLNIFTVLIIECTLIYLSLIYSSLRLIPKNMVTINYKNKPFPDTDVFVLSESKEYYTILYENDEIEFVMRDIVSQIVPNEKFEKIKDFKIENPLDEIKEILSLRNLLYFIGLSVLFALLVFIVGAFTYFSAISFFSTDQLCIIIILLLSIGAASLRWHSKIIHVINECSISIHQKFIISFIVMRKISIKLCIFCYLFPEEFPEILEEFAVLYWKW